MNVVAHRTTETSNKVCVCGGGRRSYPLCTCARYLCTHATEYEYYTKIRDTALQRQYVVTHATDFAMDSNIYLWHLSKQWIKNMW